MDSLQASEPDEGPHLSIATLCETLLQEEGGALTLVRVLDRVTITAPLEVWNSGQAIPFNSFFVVSFRAGSFEGPATIAIETVGPSESSPERQEVPVLFEGQTRGPNSGVNLNIKLTLGLRSPGQYRFDIFLNDRFVTRVPLQVVFEPISNPDQE